MTDRTCARCDEPLHRPITEHANYVRADDFVDVEPVEAHFAMVHTDTTRKKVDSIAEKIPDRNWHSLAAEAAHPDAPEAIDVVADTERVEQEDGSVVETAIKETIDFSIPEDEFEHVRVDSPSVIGDDDVALVYTTHVEEDVQKTGLVCRDCTDSEDTIIWGPDKEDE